MEPTTTTIIKLLPTAINTGKAALNWVKRICSKKRYTLDYDLITISMQDPPSIFLSQSNNLAYIDFYFEIFNANGEPEKKQSEISIRDFSIVINSVECEISLDSSILFTLEDSKQFSLKPKMGTKRIIKKELTDAQIRRAEQLFKGSEFHRARFNFKLEVLNGQNINRGWTHILEFRKNN